MRLSYSVLALATVAVLLATARGATGDELRYLKVKVSGSQGGAPVLSLSGNSITDPGEEYGVDVTLGRVPCPGKYHYAAWGGDRRVQVDTRFDTILRLDRYRTSPPGLPCKEALPATAGSRGGEVVLKNKLHTPFYLAVKPRRRNLEFPGVLTLNGVVNCRPSYRFHVTLRGPHGEREYRYRATFLSAVSWVGETAEKVNDCPLLELDL